MLELELRIAAGLTFHYIDTHGLLLKYKLHTPAEDLTKNRASKWDVIKFALIQQAAQCALGYYTADDQETAIPHEQAIASWSRMLRMIQFHGSPSLLSDRTVFYWATKRSMSYASNGLLTPQNSSLLTSSDPPYLLGNSVAGTDQWQSWDLVLAKLIYWVLVPLFQYAAAMVLADTMQYFTHRIFHVNRWLYSNSLNASGYSRSSFS